MEVVRAGDERLLIDVLLEFFSYFWVSNQLPQQFRDAAIVTAFKRKGDHCKCSNYCGISLLFIPGTVPGHGKLLSS